MRAARDRLFALVPCAGVGARSGASLPKQYASLAGRPAVAHTLEALAAVDAVEAILVVLSAADADFESLVPEFQGPRSWVERCGGATRAASVTAGLHALRARGAKDQDWVLVHDAARCLLRPEWVERLIASCLDHGVGGLLAMPLADTLKEAQADRVVATVRRQDKWTAQTPQMFRLGLLLTALEAATDEVTDESSAIERLGESPLLVTGSFENIKVTYPEDFDLAQRLLASRTQGNR
jgi:2-C-methyl-D-erythritol 4-phosphate cytidylyltransferase